MTLAPADAERLLLARYGAPAKPATDYIIGFKNSVSRVLAIHRTTRETLVWFQPPAPPAMVGVTPQAEPKNGNSNINGPLAPLRAPNTQRVLMDSPAALQRFLDWYDGKPSPDQVSTPTTSALAPEVTSHSPNGAAEAEQGPHSPSRAFTGSKGERTANYMDGDTYLYLAVYDGDSHAFVGRKKSFGDTAVAVKIGVSNDPKRRCAELNAGIPPAATGKWILKLTSKALPEMKSAEAVEQLFKDRSSGKLESLGGEFFWCRVDEAERLFLSLPEMA